MNLFDVYPIYDLNPVEAKGAYVYTADGRKILDFYGGHAVISIGHSHPHYVEKMTRQVEKLGFYSNSIINPLQNELATKLGQLSGLDNYRLFLCNSGAEANENALKLASFHNGRTKVVAFHKGFHGRTSAAVNVTDNPNIQAPINKAFDVKRIELNDEVAAKQAIFNGDVCAVIVEGIQGIAGIYENGPAFLLKLQQWCNETQTILILDEIQSGYARSGEFFAYQNSPLEPDIISMAKGMGNGFPIGGILIHPKFHAKHGLLGTTFGGNHLACAAGIAVLDVMKSENVLDNVKKQGNKIINYFKRHKAVKEVRGRGLMIGLEFDFPIAELRKRLIFEHDLFTGSSANKNTLRLLPPLTIQDHEVEEAIDKIEKGLK